MAESTPKAIDDCHELLPWIIPHLDKFPRSRRFTLGERIETGLLDMLVALTTAAYSQDKRTWLDQANRRINTVRHLWRLAHELRVIPLRQYEYGISDGHAYLPTRLSLWQNPPKAQHHETPSCLPLLSPAKAK